MTDGPFVDDPGTPFQGIERERIQACTGLAAAFLDLEGHFHMRSTRASELGEEQLRLFTRFQRQELRSRARRPERKGASSASSYSKGVEDSGKWRGNVSGCPRTGGRKSSPGSETRTHQEDESDGGDFHDATEAYETPREASARSPVGQAASSPHSQARPFRDVTDSSDDEERSCISLPAETEEASAATQSRSRKHSESQDSQGATHELRVRRSSSDQARIVRQCSFTTAVDASPSSALKDGSAGGRFARRSPSGSAQVGGPPTAGMEPCSRRASERQRDSTRSGVQEPSHTLETPRGEFLSAFDTARLRFRQQSFPDSLAATTKQGNEAAQPGTLPRQETQLEDSSLPAVPDRVANTEAAAAASGDSASVAGGREDASGIPDGELRHCDYAEPLSASSCATSAACASVAPSGEMSRAFSLGTLAGSARTFRSAALRGSYPSKRGGSPWMTRSITAFKRLGGGRQCSGESTASDRAALWAIAISPAGDWLAAAGQTGVISLWAVPPPSRVSAASSRASQVPDRGGERRGRTEPAWPGSLCEAGGQRPAMQRDGESRRGPTGEAAQTEMASHGAGFAPEKADADNERDGGTPGEGQDAGKRSPHVSPDTAVPLLEQETGRNEASEAVLRDASLPPGVSASTASSDRSPSSCPSSSLSRPRHQEDGDRRAVSAPERAGECSPAPGAGCPFERSQLSPQTLFATGGGNSNGLRTERRTRSDGDSQTRRGPAHPSRRVPTPDGVGGQLVAGVEEESPAEDWGAQSDEVRASSRSCREDSEAGREQREEANPAHSAPWFVSDRPNLCLTGHSAAIIQLVWAPTAKVALLLSSSLDKTVRLWRPAKQPEAVAVLRCRDWPTSVAFHPAFKNVVFTGCLDATVQVWRLFPVPPSSRSRPPRDERGRREHGDERRRPERGKLLWEARVVEYLKVTELVTAISISPNGSVLAVGFRNGTIAFYDAQDEASPARLAGETPLSSAERLYDSLITEKRPLASVCVICLCKQTLKFRNELDCKNRKGKFSKGRKVTSLEWHTSGLALCVTTNDSRVRIFRATDLFCAAKFKGHMNEQIMLRANYTNEGTGLVCGSENGWLCYWNVEDPRTSILDSIEQRLRKNVLSSKLPLPATKRRPTNANFVGIKAFAELLTCSLVAPASFATSLVSRIAVHPLGSTAAKQPASHHRTLQNLTFRFDAGVRSRLRGFKSGTRGQQSEARGSLDRRPLAPLGENAAPGSDLYSAAGSLPSQEFSLPRESRCFQSSPFVSDASGPVGDESKQVALDKQGSGPRTMFKALCLPTPRRVSPPGGTPPGSQMHTLAADSSASSSELCNDERGGSVLSPGRLRPSQQSSGLSVSPNLRGTGDSQGSAAIRDGSGRLLCGASDTATSPAVSSTPPRLSQLSSKDLRLKSDSSPSSVVSAPVWAVDDAGGASTVDDRRAKNAEESERYFRVEDELHVSLPPAVYEAECRQRSSSGSRPLVLVAGSHHGKLRIFVNFGAELRHL
ncbi:hypothetical protein NCLIV_024560 [Neospora caninum Liverpool]|uniref:Uncharacterized protein n=1 Tax=Neospora caninum (strain Liverpool) TaxID=572307 RepID=F0VG24_NEOCL|nr:hypothetical protein NCLIV_024560 [Neospora caninum Liverpool]CBZ52668.1 hypothetical protein NCLIV_024560 [Neospora caninum Liverpool]|eukprot:XP_003882700.1 hypothetical protein NCLIV_024560 [Neospora caninum Liverpool]